MFSVSIMCVVYGSPPYNLLCLKITDTQRGWKRDPPNTTHLSMPKAGGIAVPEIIRVGELVLPLICCMTLESGPNAMPRQNSRTDPEGR